MSSRIRQFASAQLKGNRKVVMAAVRQNGEALQYASEELKGDREVMMAADKQHDWALCMTGQRANKCEPAVCKI